MGLFNNEREIINDWKHKYHDRPSPALADKLESAGEVGDVETLPKKLIDPRKLKVKYSKKDAKVDYELSQIL